MKKGTALLALLGITITASCGGDGPGMGPNGERMVLQNPSFARDIQEVIERRGCSASTCHGSGAGGMTLTGSASQNYATWVGVASTSEPSFVRVEPGDPDDSYVVIKLEGRQSEGARMPLNAPALDDIDLANIRNWIAGGALDS